MHQVRQPNWYGTESWSDCRRLLAQLERAYAFTHDEETDRAFAVPCAHEQTAVQAIRLRIVPAEHVAGEFDAALQRTVELPPAPQRFFLREVRRISRMTEFQCQAFERVLMKGIGFEYDESGKIRKSPADLGKHTRGFGFDTKTYHSLITEGYGQHRASIALYKLIRPAELGETWLHRDNPNQDMAQRCQWFIGGIIHLRVAGFRTPILQLFPPEPSLPPEDWRAAISHLWKRQEFLIIDINNRLLRPR